MRRLATSVGALVVVLLLVPGKAQAVPLLQLDMLGGVYDPISETIVAPGGEFTVYAILTPQAGSTADEITALLNTTYYISVALMPKTGPDSADLGSFTLEGETVNVTGDMIYGVPPVETMQGFDAGDLALHGVFETYFVQVPITFNPLDTTATYNSAESPGGLTIGPGGSYYVALTGDSSLLAPGYNLHFDLYDTRAGRCGLAGTCDDIDRNHFAPFSHDASTTNVPEPASAVLLLLGLAGVGALRRRNA